MHVMSKQILLAWQDPFYHFATPRMNNAPIEEKKKE